MKAVILILIGTVLTAIMSFAALEADGNKYRLQAGSLEEITAFGFCRRIVNNTNSDIMIPVKTEIEWRSAYNSPSIFISSYCCTATKTCL